MRVGKEKNMVVAWVFAACIALAGHVAFCSLFQSYAYKSSKVQKGVPRLMAFPISDASGQPWRTSLLAWIAQANPELFVKAGVHGFSGFALSAVGHYAVKDVQLDDDEALAPFACADPRPMPLPQKSGTGLADSLLGRKSASPWLAAGVGLVGETMVATPPVFRDETGNKLDLILDDLGEIAAVLMKQKPLTSTWVSVDFAKPPLLNRVRITHSCGVPELDQAVQFKLMSAREESRRSSADGPVSIEIDWRSSARKGP